MTNPIISNDKPDNGSTDERQAGNANSYNRIVEALGDRDMVWLSKASGVPQSSLSDYKRGRTPRIDSALKIARALEVDVEWLFGEQVDRRLEVDSDDPFMRQINQMESALARQSIGPETVMIPEVDIGYSMGGGLVLNDHAEASAVPFPKGWLRPLIKGNFSQVFVARGEGDSMQPTLLDGDIVIVDTAQTSINSQDRLWCLSYGELGMIKRVRALPDGGLEVNSDNLAVRPFTAYDGEVQIIGRVVFVGRRL